MKSNKGKVYQMPEKINLVDDAEQRRKKIEQLEQKVYKLDRENTELKKPFTAKAKKLLIATSIYSFVITVLAAKNEPVFLADLVAFGKWLKDMVVFLHGLAMAASEFLAGIIENIPIDPIVLLLDLLVVVLMNVLVFGVVIVALIFLGLTLYNSYASRLADAITVGFMLIVLAICIFFAEEIRSFVPVNLIVLYILANFIYVEIRRQRQWKATGAYMKKTEW